MPQQILFTSSELFPLVKTGGLADVVGSLPAALAALGADLRIAVPAYRGWRDQVCDVRGIGRIATPVHAFDMWQARHPQIDVPLYLFDAPALFDRPGDPYHDEHHHAWPDNGARFGAFADAVAQAVVQRADPAFDPDVVHAHDWQTGLVMPWLAERGASATRIFTIHNLAYQGVFPETLARTLNLPPHWWHMEGVEFHGHLSQLKAGITYADAVTTVSPSYAREVQTPAFGFGFEGLLQSRAHRLHGIANGIDDRTWDPARDPLIAKRYNSVRVMSGKQANKLALQTELGLAQDDAPALIGVITRFAHQKGIDLVIDAMEALMTMPVQLVILGSGDRAIERELRHHAHAAPDRIALHYGYDEGLAHRIVAGADVFLMPSRFEPCGLTQMYAQRYGTVPVVHRTGGLADTVVDADADSLDAGTATGIQFLNADAGGVIYGIDRALQLRRDAAVWKRLRRTGMARDFSWRHVAARYLELYRSVGSAGAGH
ncbi:MAG: glycogen synthase GlgA [Nevskiales bacterium]|nr:glycogen synthase GlgA [Nevskiales bacterium]